MVKCLADFVAIKIDNATVFHGSNLDVLPFMADDSVDSIVTDPPYELGFMGKKWDSTGIAYSVDLWRECLRVLKPGGHLLAFGGSRTWHRLAVAIEDAGFDLRDSIAWLYGSGFPKSLDISKAIDKAAGAEREVVGSRPLTGNGKTMKSGFHQPDGSGAGETIREEIFEFTAPATPEAQQWAGWGTALKPAFEPVVVARKPLIGTVAENVLQWGVGGLNIDGSRIRTPDDLSRKPTPPKGWKNTSKLNGSMNDDWKMGRWPANIILDEYTAGLLDEQSGVLHGSGNKKDLACGTANIYNSTSYQISFRGRANREHNDSGGASRFFYVAKASKRDRNEGLEDLETKQSSGGGGGIGDYLDDVNSASGKYGSEKAPAKNFHPTVKPTDLMRYLIKLVTPAGGVVLDPFTGSGSTGKAALLDGFQFVGIELTGDYLPIVQGRLKWATDQAKQLAEAEAIKENETLF